jgi:hypothetical protein
MTLSPSDRLQLQRGAEHLLALGARALAEFLAESGAENGCTTEILEKLAAWRGALTPEVVNVAGGDRFPPTVTPVPPDYCPRRAR